MKDLIKVIYENAKAKGLHSDYEDIVSLCQKQSVDYETYQRLTATCINSKLQFIGNEISECSEALRDDDMDHFNEELADVVISCMSLAGLLEIDLEAEILKKVEINKNRPYLHGKRL